MPTQVTEIGLGRALRKARERQGLTLEDASRGTRLRRDYLDALEREAFDELAGEVYVRSFLRSYAVFLGIRPQKVIAVFERARGARIPAPAPVDRAPAVAAGRDDALTRGRRHFPWPMAASVAVIVLVAAGAIGLFSRSASTPEPARGPGAGAPPAVPETVQVDMVASGEVQARVTVDGVQRFEGTLRREEARSFQGDEEIQIWLGSGSLVGMRVNGTDLGKPGEPGKPYDQSFGRTDFREERSGG